jgi:hypothetical protein
MGQPGHVSSFGMLLDLSKELNRFRFITRFARIVSRDDRLDLDSDDIFPGLNQPCSLDPLSGNTHG